MGTIDGRVDSFAADLALESPAIERLREDQLVRHGEILEHLLLGDVTRHVLELADRVKTTDHMRTLAGVTETPSESERELLQILRTIEEWYEPANLPHSGRDKNDPDDDRVSNAIALSFLFNLPSPSDVNEIISVSLGPKLLRSYDRFWKEGTFV